MTWVMFVGSAAVIVFAATQLAGYGDVIALRTRLGGMFVGTLLLAGATSLPELLTGINAIDQGVPNLTVGNIFGSCMFNMFLLAGLDLFYWRSRILRRLAMQHALSAGIAVTLTGLSMFFILAQFTAKIGWMGLDSLFLIGVYIAMTRVMFGGNQETSADPLPAPEIPDDVPTLRRALIGFGGATLVLVLITPLLVRSSVDIAESTGMTAGFVGVALVAIITSLPEVITTISAARIGAYDLAAGNLFGSNIFNIFALGLTDIFYTDGRFLAEVSDDMMLAGIMALLLTHIALMGNMIRNLATGQEVRRLVVHVDALLIAGGYLIGMWLLFDRGLIG
ncbi:MAG: sodium:calcium antiporter [Anaerolineae bacterium]|nr:sodium:calcium antiporter [Anaerolineae bacterium]